MPRPTLQSPRWLRARRAPVPAAPEPADHGTAFGLELVYDMDDAEPPGTAESAQLPARRPWWRRWPARRAAAA
ncbi:MAG: hypothetical protein MUF03_11010 [Rubrivivax sp.]|jgi:hypothetical protein|nr:hypothetical protein [Rubrivivax sp.]